MTIVVTSGLGVDILYVSWAKIWFLYGNYWGPGDLNAIFQYGFRKK